MRRIYLVRHGMPEFPGGEKCCIGRTDLPLSEEGRGQMRALKERFGTVDMEEPEAIYTSPLKQCVESAQILSGGRIPVIEIEDMREIDMGEWEGQSFSYIRARHPEEYRRRGEDMAHFAPPGGESFIKCQNRARAVFERVQRETRGNVLLLSHAGFNRALISALEDRRLKDLMEIPQEYGAVYAHVDYIFDALITAAGLSSRMGDFKPLMELGGERILDRELDTLRAGGAREIVIVTGHRAPEIRGAAESHSFEYPGAVTCLNNEAYAATNMFDSVCIGIRYFLEKLETPEGKSLDGIFVLPVDVPLFTRFTMELEKKAFAQGESDVYCPRYGWITGHPILLRASVLRALSEYGGDKGLKGAYERTGARVVQVDTIDLGAVTDADTKQDYKMLESYAKVRDIPNKLVCRELLAWFKIGEDTARHCESVAGLAVQMAEKCNAAGAALNLDLVYAGGLLHDVGKGSVDHAAAGGRILSMLAHRSVAEVVADHMDLPEEKLNAVNESLIVFLADKLTKGEQRATIEERFAAKRARFKENPEALAALEERYRKAKRAEALFLALTDGI